MKIDLKRNTLDMSAVADQPEVLPNFPLNVRKNDMWLASSQLQKAIRHGNVDDALAALSFLRKVGQLWYFWRRIPTIAIEDVGVGNVPLVSKVCFLARDTDSQKSGGVRLIQYLTIELCNSPKDRAASDLFVLSIHSNTGKKYAKQLLKKPGYIAKTLSDPDESYIKRAVAAGILAGNGEILGDHPIPVDKSINRMVKAYNDLGVPEVAPIVSGAHKVTREKQYACLGLAMLLARKNKGALDDDLLSLPNIGPIMSSAVDKHNHYGKKAIAYFSKSCSDMSAHKFTDDDKLYREVVGRAVFRAEGQCVKDRLDYPEALKLCRMASKAIGQSLVGSDSRFMEMVSVVEENKDLLQKAREKMLEGIVEDT